MEERKQKIDRENDWIKPICDFLRVIHGNNTYEIRTFSNGRYGGVSSIVIHQDGIYHDNIKKGKKYRKLELTQKSLKAELISDFLWSEDGTIAFTVNSPNFEEMETCFSSDIHIKNGGSINCQFVDIDAPKELRENKLEIRNWKKNLINKISEFSIKPSIVVDTKNGFHVYWLLKNGEQKAFRHIQMQLIQHFDGDKNCINESRLLRLPGVPHCKDPNDQYPVSIQLLEPKNRYSQAELSKALPELDYETMKKIMASNNEIQPVKVSENRKSKIIELLLERIDSVNYYDEKITMHCCIPEHMDRKPSAWIDTKYMWYHCSGCGSSYPIRELAENLGWGEVINAWEQYDIDVEVEIHKIKQQCVSVNELEHLKLSVEDQNRVNYISNKIIETFSTYGQEINEKHKKYIYEIVQIMYKAVTEKPYIVPLDMGGGKSLIIKTFLIKYIKENMSSGAIVCVERREDIIKLVKEINEQVAANVAYPMYGFDENECLKNVLDKNEFISCPAKHTFNCQYKSQCRYWNQAKEQEKYPILIMTNQKLYQESERLTQYSSYVAEEVKLKREFLIVDEKPKLIHVKSIDYKSFSDYTNEILDILYRDKDGDLTLYYEFKEAVDKAMSIFKVDKIGRDFFLTINTSFRFSLEFWTRFYRKLDYTSHLFEIPKIVESIIKNGGHQEIDNKNNVKITTSKYENYDAFKYFKTIILDGTADIDLDYKHGNYHILNFEPLRTYSNLSFYQCDFISSSKTSMKNLDKIKALCEDVKKIAEDNPKSKIFFPVFKQNISIVSEHLEHYINKGQIIVANYGSTRGSNKFKDCSIVILGGILQKSENYYLGKVNVLHKKKDIEVNGIDTSCSNYDSVRRFNSNDLEIIKIMDMLVDYSQEIKRSKQRDNSKNIEGKVYVFHNDKILLDLIRYKFPESQVEEWHPLNVMEEGMYKKKNNKNVQAIYDYIKSNIHKKEISFSEIREAVGIKKNQFSNIMNNKNFKLKITALGYRVVKNDKNKREKKLVKI